MSRCKDCRFWNREIGYGEEFPLRGTCDSPKMLRGYYRSDKSETIPLDAAIVENDEGWGIITGPEFGCVLFEPKPNGASA